MKKRFFAILMVLILALCMLPMAANADEATGLFAGKFHASAQIFDCQRNPSSYPTTVSGFALPYAAASDGRNQFNASQLAGRYFQFKQTGEVCSASDRGGSNVGSPLVALYLYNEDGTPAYVEGKTDTTGFVSKGVVCVLSDEGLVYISITSMGNNGFFIPNGTSKSAGGSASLSTNWKKDPTLGDLNNYDASEVPIASDEVLVRFNANGGTPAPAQQAVAVNGKVTEPAEPAKTGFDFGGWFRYSDLSGDAWDFANNGVTAAMTLYAKWTAVPQDSATPATGTPTVTKSTVTQKAVDFALTTAPAGTYKVYANNETTSVHDTVTASLSGSTLTLSDSGTDIAAGAYYVSVTEDGKNESARLPLTVQAKSATPATDTPTVAKSTVTQKAVDFALTTAPAGTYKVYANNETTSVHDTVTTSLSGSTLTLSDSGTDIAAGAYYVSVTEDGKAESARLPLTVQAKSATPATDTATVAKAAVTQKAVDYTLTTAPTGTYKVYANNDAADVHGTVTASLNGSTLTLSDSGTDIAAGAYYVSVTEVGKAESARLPLTVQAKSVTPATNRDTVPKGEVTQKSVSFALTTAPTGTYKVYASDTATAVHGTVSASFNGNTLTLSESGSDLAAGTYFVSVTEDGKAESARLPLTVQAKSVAPTTNKASVVKTSKTQSAVEFTLTNPPATSGSWKVYDAASGGREVHGLTVTVNGAKLTLSGATDVPAGTYYIAFTGEGQAESARLPLTVGAYVPPAASIPGTGDSATPWLWLAIGLVCVLALAVVLIIAKKRKQDK